MTRLATCSAVVLLTLVSAATAAAQQIDSLEFRKAGIFTGRTVGAVPSPNTATGTISIIADKHLVEETERVCARLGVLFGINFVLHGAPTGQAVTLDMITRFPDPGMVNAKGQRFRQNVFESQRVIGAEEARTFGFDEPWEMVAGTWVFEFHYRGRKLAERSFYVMTACETS